MRTLGFRTHVLLSLIAAAGIRLALGMPWYGSAPKGGAYIDGPMDRTLEAIGRAVSAGDGQTGREVLGGSATAISVLAAFTALMALLCLSAATFGVAREGLRLGALATLGVIAWRLVDHPADELRHGALVAAACAVVLTSAAMSTAAAPMRRKRAVFGHPGVFVPPPAPPVWDSTESAPPPGAGGRA
jgi:hypothetical protein